MSANDSDDEISALHEPSNLIVSVVFSCYLFYTAAIVIGIPCNVFVLYRMTRLSRRCAEMYSNGVGLCLFVMAIADIGSLFLNFVNFNLEQYSSAPQVIAGLHRKRTRLDLSARVGEAMFTVITAAVVSNAWLLISVESNPSGGCTMVSLFGYQQINKAFLLIESTVSFIIPTLIIVYMDASVLLGLQFRRITKKAERPDLRRNMAPNPN
ncbi:hypothetical protein COOONC_23090, partial [Cooperia oncophora]